MSDSAAEMKFEASRWASFSGNSDGEQLWEFERSGILGTLCTMWGPSGDADGWGKNSHTNWAKYHSPTCFSPSPASPCRRLPAMRS